MLLGSPDVTPYDLRFRLLGIPVRVHPLFWLVMLLISSNRSDFRASLIFVACAFISILIHEMGHGLASRLMGDEPVGIVLYAMGGFCAFHQNRLSPWRRVFVLISGPGAGFLLMGAMFALLIFVGAPEAPGLRLMVEDLIFINLVWGILNLFPLWPLDGGQITGTVLGMVNARHGMRWAHIISLLTAGCLAVWRITAQDLLMAVWFGYFALINYQILHSLHLAYQTSDEPEWWRR